MFMNYLPSLYEIHRHSVSLSHWLIVSCVVLSGCVSVGNSRVASDQIMADIHVGETTRDQVKNLLGEPDSQISVDIGGSTREWWSYTYASAVINPIEYLLLYGLFFNGIGMFDTRYDVGVFFDHHEVVRSLSRVKSDYDMGSPFAPLRVSSVSNKTTGSPEPGRQSIHYEDTIEFRP
jgi:hypothetical protein